MEQLIVFFLKWLLLNMCKWFFFKNFLWQFFSKSLSLSLYSYLGTNQRIQGTLPPIPNKVYWLGIQVNRISGTIPTVFFLFFCWFFFVFLLFFCEIIFFFFKLPATLKVFTFLHNRLTGKLYCIFLKDFFYFYLLF